MAAAKKTGTMKKAGKGLKPSKIVKPKASGKATAQKVAAWDDDPMSGALPVTRDLPDLSTAAMKVKITEAVPAPKVYAPGSREFRYWAAADALARGSQFWSSITGLNRWQPGDTLKVTLDAGAELNAYYDRVGLSFFHDTAGGKIVYSGESPDVVCHEMGHAVLDVLRPELWDVMSGEVAAFHESFGDMSAILIGLQLSGIRQQLTAGGSPFYQSSRLSRLAEQLGWALRQRRPDSAPPDCLRNAVNSFFYRAPDTLRPSGPDSELTSEPHSFSRVFTGGFYEALSNMLETIGGINDANLLEASDAMAHLLADAVQSASVVPEFYSQVAAHFLDADRRLYQGKYNEALKSAFVRRGILSLQSMVGEDVSPAASSSRSPRGMVAPGPAATGLPMVKMSGNDFGMGAGAIVMYVPGETRKFAVSSAAPAMGAAPQPTDEQSARSFAEYLFRRGRVDLKEQGNPTMRVTHPYARKTHELIKRDGNVVLVRRNFDCGLD